MKLCFSTLGCTDWSLDEIVQYAKNHNFTHLELRGINGVLDVFNMPEFYDENLKDTHDKIKNAGLSVAVVGTSASFHDEKRVEICMNEAKRCIDVACALEAPYIRVFGNNIPEDEDEYTVIKRVSKYIKELCGYGKNKGVTVLLEVHGDFNTHQRLLEVEKWVCEQNFGLIWDVGHSDVVYKENYMEFYTSIKHLVKHVHIKDHIRNADGTLTLCNIGCGDIPLCDIVKMIKKDKPEICLSIEWERKWHPELQEASGVFAQYAEWVSAI